MSKYLLSRLIDNKIKDPGDSKFSAIIGKNPSNGARSPFLWDAAFKELDINIKMLPLDISDYSSANNVLNWLQEDMRFIGGAITAPYKSTTSDWLGDSQSEEAKTIGAVNCLRRTSDGRLFGTNTDGEGAVKSLTSAGFDFTNKSVLVLGIGGAGLSVATYVNKAISGNGRLFLANKDEKKSLKLAKSLRAKHLTWPVLPKYLIGIDLLVNCTSVGTSLMQIENIKSQFSLSLTCLGNTQLLKDKKDSDLVNDNYEQSMLRLKKLKTSAWVFDINYNPPETFLLKIASSLNLQTLNGSSMNLYQAVLGFSHVVTNSKVHEKTFDAMNRAVKQI